MVNFKKILHLSGAMALFATAGYCSGATVTDTGVNKCYAPNSNQLVSCTAPAALILNNQQDGMIGLDVSQPKKTDGWLGFSYTKISSTGAALPVTASSWACVKDRVTGKMWEVKTADYGFRDYRNTYTNIGDLRSGDSSEFVETVNSLGLCGYKNWRIPTRAELQNIVDYGVSATGQPSIDVSFFPNTIADGYWTQSPVPSDPERAWYIGFFSGNIHHYGRGNLYYIRLVR